jgi:hypothetical protein
MKQLVSGKTVRELNVIIDYAIPTSRRIGRSR